MSLREDQLERYSRQIWLPNVGEKGQEKLLKGKALIVGTGGLGSPCALYLNAAGVGKIGIADSDKVDISNLQRQILHNTERIGTPKIESAKKTMNDLNPDSEIVTYNIRIKSENIMDIIKDYDIVVDCADNYATRYLVNDACILSRKPLVHGSVFRFDGHAITIFPGKSPCYRCLFPEPPPEGLVVSPQKAGILGAAAGVIGVVQANEVVKYLVGIGDLLRGKLLTVNVLDWNFRQLKVARNPECPVCGKNAKVTKLEDIDYEQCCQIKRR